MDQPPPGVGAQRKRSSMRPGRACQNWKEVGSTRASAEDGVPPSRPSHRHYEPLFLLAGSAAVASTLAPATPAHDAA